MSVVLLPLPSSLKHKSHNITHALTRARAHTHTHTHTQIFTKHTHTKHIIWQNHTSCSILVN
jgi:hypothetical protein